MNRTSSPRIDLEDIRLEMAHGKEGEKLEKEDENPKEVDQVI